ncbi:MAG: DUF3488 domain-containing protein [Deltaproteobacteria bacterium]|nr:DUF3488 domain-containing protein [Deltaproteobacteria bacterium]
MSRKEFRVPVEGPLPLGAVLTAAIASIILGLSGALPAWILCLQALSILATMVLREKAMAWQNQTIPFIVGFILVSLICALTYTGSILITVGTAAMLFQGLLLLNARPRRTRFPLVGLALTQVLVGSVLTTNVFYSIFVVLFLMGTLWTLLLHTLQAEAFEAGDPKSAYRVATPGLIRMALGATGVTVLMALPIFVALPRMHSELDHSGAGPVSGNQAGFSDRVQLGALGPIRSDPSIQMQIYVEKGPVPQRTEAYWRGMSFDTFDGWEWSVSPKAEIPGLTYLPMNGYLLGGERHNRTQSIIREPVIRGVVFTTEQTQLVGGGLRALDMDGNGSIFAPMSDRAQITYSLHFNTQPSSATLATDAASAMTKGRQAKRFLQLPESPELKATLDTLVAKITQEGTSDANKARRIERYLQTHGVYSNVPPQLDRDRHVSPIQGFLEDGLEAHCEYFATSMVLLARSAGLPARLVNGFAGGRLNTVGEFIEVAGSDAHSWVELHFEDVGWVRFDPTPADLRLSSEPELGVAQRLIDSASAVKLWWFRHVIDFNSNTQMQMVEAGRLQAKDLFHSMRKKPDPKEEGDKGPGFVPKVSLGLMALLLIAILSYKLYAKRIQDPIFINTHYVKALSLLKRRGIRPQHTHTARDFLAVVQAGVSPKAADAFRRLTRSYEVERYGNRKSLTAGEELRDLRDSLRA